MSDSPRERRAKKRFSEFQKIVEKVMNENSAIHTNLDFEKSYAELIKLYSKLMLLADKLVETDGHAVACRFTGCTCGSIEAYKIARAEYLDFRRKYTGED